MTGKTIALLALLAASSTLAAGPAAAATAPPRDGFPLGISAINGAPCEALRDWDDPIGLAAGRRAWTVRCRGFEQTLGHIYLFQAAADAGQTVWREGLAKRAECDPASRAALPKVAGAAAVSCKTIATKAAYVAYEVRQGNAAVTADGLSGAADVLAIGLEVAAGRIKPPPALARQADSGVSGEIASLNAAADVGAASFDKQKEAAYREAQLWRFGDAESRFSGMMIAADTATATDRAEAALNVAMNASNAGRFKEAEAYFKASDSLIAQANAGWLKALALNNRAAHARNQRKFDDAIALAQQAMSLRTAQTAGTGLDITPISDGGVTFGPSAANALNSQGKGLAIQIGVREQALIRDAQALQVIGTSQAAMHREAEARDSLGHAADILAQPFGSGVLGDSAPWLTARVQGDLAKLDRDRGDVAAAVKRLQTAVNGYSTRYPGSVVTGHFLVELARAKAANRQEDEALTDYEAAFDIFRQKRGSLGDSADNAGTYFDILLNRIGDNPAAHPEEVKRFYASTEALIGESLAAAQRISAQRLAAGGTPAAALSRARDGLLREIDEQQALLRQGDQAGVLTADEKKAGRDRIETLRVQANGLEQRILEADPRYKTTFKANVGLEELQRALQPGEGYLKVLLLANRGYGLLVTPTEARPYGIELTRKQAEQEAAQLRLPFDKVAPGQPLGRYDVALARKVYQQLFQPVDAQLGGLKRLVYQPDPALVGVPIGALVTDDDSLRVMFDNLNEAKRTKSRVSYRGVSWLGQRLETSVSISTGGFVNARQMRVSNAAKTFLGFADPVISTEAKDAFASVAAPAAWVRTLGYDYCASTREQLMTLPRLPETAAEVTKVALAVGSPQNVVLGADFTDARVKKLSDSDELDQYRVLYFATHGLLPQANGCLQPSLVTSAGGGDALLDTREIPNLNLDADLVVLSACNTGAQADGGGGSALGGLISTFTQAGVRNLLVSNWQVDSTATELLMTTLFTSKAATQDEALKAAQAAFMQRSDAYSHPFYWAAFSLVGDGGRPLPKL